MADVVEIIAQAQMCASDYTKSEVAANVKDRSGIYEDYCRSTKAVLTAATQRAEKAERDWADLVRALSPTAPLDTQNKKEMKND